MSAIDYTKAYITHNDGTSLATIDENDNFVDLGTFVDSRGTPLSKVYGLAFGKDGEIYLTQQNGGSNETFSGTDTQIWKANLPAVGGNVTLTKVGTGLGVYDYDAINTHAMDIGPDGSMYILDLLGNIFTVDLSTGLANFVAETVINGAAPADAKIAFSMDIVFDSNFTLYAQGTHPDNTSRLFTVNASTGAATSVGSFGSGTNIMGLWTNSEDTIYATKYSNPGNLYTVNSASAALTLVGNAGDYGNRPHGGDQWIAYGGWPGSDPPTLSSATYNASNGALSLSGSNLPAYPGANNDIDVSKLTITGGSGSTYNLTTGDVELTSATAASITLNNTDQTNLDSLLNKNGTASSQGNTYNIAAADDWAPGADASINSEDLTGNGITVSNIPNRAPTGSVTISGTPTQGQTLTAANTLADADGLGTIAYGWMRSGTAINIPDPSSTTYTLVQADVGSAISVTASYTDQQGTAESVSSSATSAVKALVTPTPERDKSNNDSSSSSSNSNNSTAQTNENSLNNRRTYLTENVDSLINQFNFNFALLNDNDYLEVTGGKNNFANGNGGDDYFIVFDSQYSQFLGGKGRDFFAVKGGTDNFFNGAIGEDTFIITAGRSRVLGGNDNDTIQVVGAAFGTSVNGNRGNDFITGVVAGVTYRGGKDNDVLAVSQGDVRGDLGVDTFRGVSGDGYALIQDYTVGEDKIDLSMVQGGSWTNVDNGLMFTDASGDQIMLLVGIKNMEQISLA